MSDGVVNEVGEHLFHSPQIDVDLDVFGFIRQVDFQADAGVPGVGFKLGAHAFEQRVKTDWGFVEGQFPGLQLAQVIQIVDEAFHLLGLRLDLAQKPVPFFARDHIFQQGFTVPLDQSEGRPQVMGKVGHHLQA